MSTNFLNFADNAQQCFAFTPQANFPTHNLNFHWSWRWWDQIQATSIFYCNCSNLSYLRNLQEQVKKHSVTKNCSDLSLFEQIVLKPSASNFKFFSPSLEQFFSYSTYIGQNNFGNKILLLFPLDMRHYNFISIGHDTDYWVLHSTQYTGLISNA